MSDKMIRTLKWLRWPNLVIVFLTMAFIRYGLLGSWFLMKGLAFSLSNSDFLLLCLLTMLVTFGGYVINDIYDEETDRKNKPDKMAIGNLISRGMAKSIYLLVTLFGLAICLYLGYAHDKLQWTWIYPMAVGLLWWYSKTLKGTVLWGNFLVSVFCAGVALLVPFTEKEQIQLLYDGSDLLRTLYFYAFFAGASNMLREIVKDAEDVEGDAATRKKTLAVVYGISASKKWTMLWAVVLLISMALYFSVADIPYKKVLVFAILTLPWLGIMSWELRKNTASIQWKKLSRLAKLLMVGGLLGFLFLV